MFLLYVIGLLAIAPFNWPSVQAQEEVFECFSWGDPHVQTWHPQSSGAIHNRDCLVNGDHTLVHNKFADVVMDVENTLAVGVNVKFYNGQSKNVVCHIHLTQAVKKLDEQNCNAHGITITVTKVGAETTYNINYQAANVLISIREIEQNPTFCYYNIYVWQPQSLVDQSTGICGLSYGGCGLRAAGTDGVEAKLARTGSAGQLISREQAASICNDYVDAYFLETHRAPHERHTNLVANVVTGCIDDVVLTGQVEMARAGLDVLMMQELTEGATSIDSIQAALRNGVEAASVKAINAAKMAQVRARRLF